MSKPSTATKPSVQLPHKSAWAKGPPPNTSAASSPRSQSPAPNNAPVAPSHSRRPSALGGAGPIKDGVGISRNAGPVKQASSTISFGSVNDSSPPAPSPPSETPAVKTDARNTVPTFGSIAANSLPTNGKPLVATPSTSSTSAISSSKASSNTASTATSNASTPTSNIRSKLDVGSLFRGGGGSAGTTPSASSPVSAPDNTASPSTRPSSLPPQPYQQSFQSQPSQAPHGVHQPQPQGSPGQTQMYAHFQNQAMRAQAQNNANMPGGSRSPSFSRPALNGTPAGVRPPGPPGPQGPNSAGLSSPRMGPPHQMSHPPPHPHQGQPVPGVPPQMQGGWSPYYYHPGYMPNPAEQYMHPGYMQQSWHPAMQGHPQPPGTPHHGPIPVSPRNAPPPLQPPATPPASAIQPPQSARLNSGAPSFVPGPRHKSAITIKDSTGHEVDLNALKKGPMTPTTPGPTAFDKTQNRKSIRIENPDAKKKREEEERKRKEEIERKVKEVADRERQRKEEEERKRKEAEEKERVRKEEEKKRKEEEERARKEEEERTRRAAEEKKRKEEEKLRLQQEEEERVRKEEEERKRKEEEVRLEAERQKQEEEERIRREEEEKERIKKEEEEKARKEEEERVEAEKRQKEEDERKQREEEERKAQDAAIKVKEDDEINEKDGETSGKSTPPPSTTPISPPSHDTHKRPRPIPGPLDLSSTHRSDLPQPLPSALATARHIHDLDEIKYPEGIKSPKPELNEGAKGGKFRYDRDFLMQFMSVCKEKPDNLPPLDLIGLEPADQSHAMGRGGSGRRGVPGSMGPPSAGGRQQNGMPAMGFPGKPGGFAMGQFATAGKLTSEERFMRSTSVSGPPMSFPRQSPMVRSASQGGAGMPMGSKRTRSKRGEPRGDKMPPPPGPSSMLAGPGLDSMSLSRSANAWAPNSLGGGKRVQAVVDENAPEIVERKVKGLLNKLTMEKFDSISNQIIAWANKSENEKDGRTLILVIKLVFEKATDEATWSEMYARLCRKMMEQISPNVQDEGIKNNEGTPISGGQLFRKYLLNRCQEDFERGWASKEATAAAAATKASDDQAVREQAEKTGEKEEAALYSEEYYAAQKAKRQGLGLVKFIGELFKLQMLTERIMHECIKKLLSNVENPEEEEIESLCKLLATIGEILDTPKARAHMDVYFSRMRDLTKSPNVNSRMQFMLLDILELRDRKWITRNQTAAPTTIAAVHEQAAKEKAHEAQMGRMGMSRGGSRRGHDRSEMQPDGWSVQGGSGAATRAPAKVGDLSGFGKFSNSKAAPMTFGPSSVFNKKDSKRDSAQLSRTGSSSNMFSLLNQNPEAAESAAFAKSSRPSSRKPSVDLSPADVHALASGSSSRPKLNLLPRSKPVTEEASAPSEPGSDVEGETGAAATMTEAEAKKKVAEDLKEFFSIRNLDEAESYFTRLPAEHAHILVEELVTKSLESKEADAKLVGDLFNRAVEKELCSAAVFEAGLSPAAELLDDVAIDAPKAPHLYAIMLKGAHLSDEQSQAVASKSAENGDKILQLLSS